MCNMWDCWRETIMNTGEAENLVVNGVSIGQDKSSRTRALRDWGRKGEKSFKVRHAMSHQLCSYPGGIQTIDFNAGIWC